jgi:hypothetical protein
MSNPRKASLVLAFLLELELLDEPVELVPLTVDMAMTLVKANLALLVYELNDDVELSVAAG